MNSLFFKGFSILFPFFFLSSISLKSQPLLPEPIFEGKSPGGLSGFFNMEINPRNSNDISGFGDLTGLIRTKDGGLTWHLIPFQKFRACAQSKLVFTGSPDIIYSLITEDFVLGHERIVVSRDDGETWELISADPCQGDYNSIFASHLDADKFMVADDHNLFLTSDGGQTFELIFQSNSLYVGGAFWTGDKVFIGTGDGILFHDPILNSTMETTPTQMIDQRGILNLSGGMKGDTVRLWAVARDTSCVNSDVSTLNYKTLDCPAQQVYVLEQIGNEPLMLKYKTDFSGIGLPFLVSGNYTGFDTVFVAGASLKGTPAVFRSTNGGANWENTFKTDNNENIETIVEGTGGQIDWGWAETSLGFKGSPTNPNVLIMTDFSALHISKDGGENWTAVYGRLEDLHAAGSNTPRWEYHLSNGSANNSSTMIFFIDENKMMMGLADVAAAYSKTKGEEWQIKRRDFLNNENGRFANSIYKIVRKETTPILYAGGSQVHDLFQTTHIRDARLALTADDNGGIWVSPNDGVDWQLLKSFPFPVTDIIVDPSDSDIMYAALPGSVEKGGGIYKTETLSAGNSAIWEKLPSPPRTEGHAWQLGILEDGTLWSVYSARMLDSLNEFTSSSGIFISEDGGVTWEDRTASNMQFWVKNLTIAPSDPNQNTWIASVWNGWGNIFKPDFADGFGGVYRSQDRGLNWTRLDTIFDRVEQVAIHPVNHDIAFISTEFQGLWVCTNFTDAAPEFHPINSYPFFHPYRVYFNPFDLEEVWVTAFGWGASTFKLPYETSSSGGINISENCFISLIPTLSSGEIRSFSKEEIYIGNEVELKIFSRSGKTIFYSEEHIVGTSVKLSNQLDGIYFWRIKTADSGVLSGKFVIKR